MDISFLGTDDGTIYAMHCIAFMIHAYGNTYEEFDKLGQCEFDKNAGLKAWCLILRSHLVNPIAQRVMMHNYPKSSHFMKYLVSDIGNDKTSRWNSAFNYLKVLLESHNKMQGK